MSPNKQFLMAGYCDNKLRLINTLSWKEVFCFDHASDFDELNQNNIQTTDVNIYVENETQDDGPLYEAVNKNYKIQKITQEEMRHMQKSTGLPKVGISNIKISSDSQYVATVCENTPKCVWIWDLQKLQLNTLLVQVNDVTSICWAPNTLNLNISSSDGKIYLWSLRGASVCQVPQMQNKESFKVSSIEWNSNGKNFAAIEKNQGLVFVYPQLQFFQQEEEYS